jgi:arsenate reductase (thioredoxin)
MAAQWCCSCVHNAGSQMALGFFTHLAADRAIGWSGGCEPGIDVNPAAIETMAARGIEHLTDEVVRAADVVVTMGCGDACPVFPGTRYENWELDDLAGSDPRRDRTPGTPPARPTRRADDSLALAAG